MTKRWLPDHVTEYKDRHGKARYRYRRTGYKTHHFRHAPGTEAFREELALCKSDTLQPAFKVARGSFDDLLARYYRSPDFLDPSERTRTVYRGVIENWRKRRTKSGNRYGAAMVTDLTAARVSEWMADMLPHRTSANMLRKRLSALMDFAIRQGMATTNPVKATKPFKIDSEGHHPWSEEEITAYEARHAVGTRARLGFDLLLWSGQRGGDVRLMGPNNIVNKRLVVTQEKTGVTVALPIMPQLAASILASAKPGPTFLATEYGKTFSRKGFGNWFRSRCDEAGLTHCSAHGLRKAAARRFAEAGCSNQQIKSWTGHTTDAEVARYTASASQLTLSDSAAEMLLAAFPHVQSGEPVSDGMANPSESVDNA